MQAFFIIPLLIGLAAVYGWIANIVKIVYTLGDPTITPMLVARIIGAFVAPIGAVLGFF